MALKPIEFKDFITLQRGFDLPKNSMVDGEYPVLGSTSIIGHHNEYKVSGPGVVTGRSGSLGEVQYIEGNFWAHNTALWVKDFKGNYPKYVYYLLKTLDLKRFNSGVGVPTLNRNDLDKLPVKVFDLLSQQKIAFVLSAYDDLMEYNLKRINILEEMAQMIYREWFVNFRFPEHEKVKMVKSELGMIPEGWEVKKLNQVSENYDRKRKPLSKMQREKLKGIYPYYGAAKIFDYINDYIFDGDYLLIAEDGSVITEDGFPVLQLTCGKFWANNHTHILQGKLPISTEYLYLMLKKFDIKGYITGAAQPKITQENLNRINVLAPDEIVSNQFNQLIKDFFVQIQLIEKKNNNLRQTRDLLLPKLISGQIDVEDLDINTENLN